MIISFTLNARFAPYYWCVYQHRVEIEPRPIWIGVCRLRDVITAPDARRLAEWRKIADHYQDMITTVIALEETEQRAQTIAQAAILIHDPHCNKFPADPANGRNTAIICVQDGLTWQSIAAAAKHYRLNSSSIAKHLAAKPGYSTLHGLQFKRLETDT